MAEQFGSGNAALQRGTGCCAERLVRSFVNPRGQNSYAEGEEGAGQLVREVDRGPASSPYTSAHSRSRTSIGMLEDGQPSG